MALGRLASRLPARGRPGRGRRRLPAVVADGAHRAGRGRRRQGARPGLPARRLRRAQPLRAVRRRRLLRPARRRSRCPRQARSSTSTATSASIPALAPLKPLYDDGRLAFVQAVGNYGLTRSHFDAQDFMESGTPGDKSTTDGWLDRAVAALPGSEVTQAVAFSVAAPALVPGPGAGAGRAEPRQLRPARAQLAERRPRRCCARMYDGGDDRDRAHRPRDLRRP